MSSIEITPRMIHLELASLLERGLFADINQALQQTAAEYSVEDSGILARAFYGDDRFIAIVPEYALDKSLDHISETYLKPAVQQFLFKAWETNDV
jgi:hypothetical protein